MADYDENMRKSPGKIDPDYKPRFVSNPIMHHAEALSRNSHHLGMEMPREESPLSSAMGQLERVINEVDASVSVLLQKLAPGLTPEYAEDVAEDGPMKSLPQSAIVLHIHREVDRLRELRNLLERTASRVEL